MHRDITAQFLERVRGCLVKFGLRTRVICSLALSLELFSHCKGHLYPYHFPLCIIVTYLYYFATLIILLLIKNVYKLCRKYSFHIICFLLTCRSYLTMNSIFFAHIYIYTHWNSRLSDTEPYNLIFFFSFYYHFIILSVLVI